MAKRIQRVMLGVAALAALALGGAVFAQASPSPSRTQAAHPSQAPERVSAADRDNVQSGDQTTPDRAAAGGRNERPGAGKAAQAGGKAEPSSEGPESSAASDGPGDTRTRPAPASTISSRATSSSPRRSAAIAPRGGGRSRPLSGAPAPYPHPRGTPRRTRAPVWQPCATRKGALMPRWEAVPDACIDRRGQGEDGRSAATRAARRGDGGRRGRARRGRVVDGRSDSLRRCRSRRHAARDRRYRDVPTTPRG